MYRIDVYKRKQDGNRGKLLFSSRYKSEEEAKNAKKALIKLSNRVNLAPRDIECINAKRPKEVTVSYNLLYYKDGEKVFEKIEKLIKTEADPTEYIFWNLKGYIVANPVKE